MKAIKRILVPTEFSENSRFAFDYALDMAEKMKAEVKVVHIYSDFIPNSPFGRPRLCGLWQKRLKKCKKICKIS